MLINRRAVINNRLAIVDRLYAANPGADIGIV